MEAPPIDDLENLVVRTVADWVDAEVKPTVRAVERSGVYPDQFIDAMKDLGLFGLCIPEPWGEARVSIPCFARVTEELARGWMSLAGALGGHSVVSSLIVEFGTDEQREKYLPRLATGELRATMALTEPDGGSDLQAMRTLARRDGDDYIVNGSKTWISNGRRSGLVALLCKTDANADPVHRGMSILLVETGTTGLVISDDIPKLGYKGIEACELTFGDCRVPAHALLGDEAGRGFAQMMRGLEIGRIQVAARAVGVGRAAYEDSFAYAQEREAFGVPIWQHQSIGNYLADMATSLHASRLLVLDAAERLEAGKRVDLEAGMAKLFASETAMKIALDAIRIHGGYGYSTEYDVERYFRDAPLMIVGEGTNEIQRNVIVRQLINRAGLL
jgi:alkylation response protein AidB-like acyl-CoA dehydrogenase